MSLKPFTFTVTVEVERTEGKFASREDIAYELAEQIEQMDPGSISLDESEYEVTSFEVGPG